MTTTNHVKADAYSLGISIMLSLLISLLTMMLIAVLVTNEVLQQEKMGYAIAAVLPLGVLAGSLAIRAPVGGKRLILCTCCGCGCYLGLIVLHNILIGQFSLGIGWLWVLGIGAGVAAGLCGKRRRKLITKRSGVRKFS